MLSADDFGAAIESPRNSFSASGRCSISSTATNNDQWNQLRERIINYSLVTYSLVLSGRIDALRWQGYKTVALEYVDSVSRFRHQARKESSLARIDRWASSGFADAQLFSSRLTKNIVGVSDEFRSIWASPSIVVIVRCKVECVDGRSVQCGLQRKVQACHTTRNGGTVFQKPLLWIDASALVQLSANDVGHRKYLYQTIVWINLHLPKWDKMKTAPSPIISETYRYG